RLPRLGHACAAGPLLLRRHRGRRLDQDRGRQDAEEPPDARLHGAGPLLVRRELAGRALRGFGQRPGLQARRQLVSRTMRVQFVDCRWELGHPEIGRALYLAGHVPGASFLDVETDLSAPPGGTDGGRHPLPAPDDFARAAGAAGIGHGTLVVAYDQGMNGGAARLWWLLRHFGHENVAVLVGGLDSWIGPLRAGKEQIEPAEFHLRPREDALISAEEIQERLGKPGFVVVDARV